MTDLPMVERLDGAPGGGDDGYRQGAEFLDAVIAPIRNVDIAGVIYRHAYREVELPVPAPRAAPLVKVSTAVGKDLDAVIDCV